MSTTEMSFYQANPRAPWYVLASICIALFLLPLSLSSVNVALPAIAHALQADAVAVSWIPTATLWGSIVLMLPGGRVADMFGRKPVYLTGVLGFSLSSLLILAVNSIEFLLVLRVLQGLFSGLVFATAMAIIASVFSDRSRGTALGLTGTSVYLGLTCGPLIGGWLTEHLGWRSVFLGPVPLAVIAIVLAVIYIRKDHDSSKAIQPLDWKGSLLFVVVSTLLLFGLSGLPETYSWLLLIAGVVSGFIFVRQQNNCEYPLVRFSVLAANRLMNRSLLTSLFMYAANFPVLFLLSLYLQYLQGLSPSETGQIILLQALIMAFLAPISGRLSDRFEPRIISTIGCLVACTGFITLVLLQADSSLTHVLVALSLLGVGFGLFSTPNDSAALGSVPKERLSIVSALLSLARSGGNMISISIIMMLMSLFVGSEQISPERYPDLLMVVKLGFATGCVYSLLAAWSSYSRGRVTRAS